LCECAIGFEKEISRTAGQTKVKSVDKESAGDCLAKSTKDIVFGPRHGSLAAKDFEQFGAKFRPQGI
jgi:hypothetical protein